MDVIVHPVSTNLDHVSLPAANSCSGLSFHQSLSFTWQQWASICYLLDVAHLWASVLALKGKKRWFSLRGFWTSKDSFLWFQEEQWKKGVVKRIHCSIVNKIRRSRCGSEHLQHVILVLISHQQPAVFLSLPPDLQFRVKPVHLPEEGDILSVLFYDPLQPSVTLCTNLFTHLQILAAYIKL